MLTVRLVSIARIGVLACCLAALVPPRALAQARAGDSDMVKIAEEFAGDVSDGRYEEAVKRFDEAMAKALPAEKLKEVWESVQTSAGSFESLGKSTTTQSKGLTTVIIPAVFKKTTLSLSISVDAEGRIAGFWIRPGGAAATYAAADYDKPDRYREKEVEFGEKPWRIKGKLTRPKGVKAAPAVVLVHGSGPHDEDETIGPNKPFRDLAGGLSSRGIAVLRYQKRTFAHAGELAKQKTITVREEVIDDALEALEFLRKQKGIDKEHIYLLGHSLGGTLAPQIAAEDKKLAGVILMAGAPRDFFEVIEEQLTYIASLPGPQQEANKKGLEEARQAMASARAPSAPPDLTLLGVPISYWREVSGYATKSPKVLGGLDCRVMVLGGGRDYQVTRADFDVYSKALKDNAGAKLKWYDNVSHLFVEGKGKSTPAEYAEPNHVSKTVVRDLADWIKGKGQQAAALS
jgi:dienelactone hydrolase